MRREAHIWHPVHDVYGSGAANAWDVVVELGGCGGRVGGMWWPSWWGLRLVWHEGSGRVRFWWWPSWWGLRLVWHEGSGRGAGLRMDAAHLVCSR